MGRRTTRNFLEATVDYGESANDVGPSSQDTTVALFGLKPVYHQGIDSLGGWRRH